MRNDLVTLTESAKTDSSTGERENSPQSFYVHLRIFLFPIEYVYK